MWSQFVSIPARTAPSSYILQSRKKDVYARARAHMHKHTRACSSLPPPPPPTNIDFARGGETAEGKSFGQRSLDNRASSYRRASLRRDKDAGGGGAGGREKARFAAIAACSSTWKS